MGELRIHPVTSGDSDWARRLLKERWGSSVVVSRGKSYEADRLAGFVACEGEERIGLVTYAIKGTECEVVTLDSLRENRGVGSALLKAAVHVARQAGCECLRLMTTNDNLRALRFYQRYGFVLVALHRNAVERSRKMKPEIPLTGYGGIPIRDEIELELDIRGHDDDTKDRG